MDEIFLSISSFGVIRIDVDCGFVIFWIKRLGVVKRYLNKVLEWVRVIV